jgi:hypothetical protein
MPTTIKLKNSVTTTNVPSSLAQGEVAINVTDKKVWVGNAATTPVQLLGTGSDGSFTNLTVSGTTALNGGTTLGDASGDALTINSSAISIPNGLNFDSNTLVIDATNNRVGVGTASPSFALDVFGSSGVGIRLLENSTGNNNRLVISQSGTSTIYNSTYASGSANHVFQIADTEAMRIDSSGNVGIGTSSPRSPGGGFQGLTLNGSTSGFLDINTNGTRVMTLFGSGNDAVIAAGVSSGVIGFTTNSAERMRIDSSGNLQIGTTAVPNSRLVTLSSGSTSATSAFTALNSGGFELFRTRDDGLIFTGTRGVSPYNNTTASAANVFVNSDGTLARSTSSLKYKTDVQNAKHGLAEVLKLRSVTYKGKSETDGDKIFGGLIAEEVDEIGLTEFVVYRDDDGTPDALNYGNMVSLAFKAIQEQQAIINDLKARIETLESK